jgi:hypothetical protein
MLRKFALAALVFALGSVTAMAADFNGKWTAEVQGRNGTQTVTFDFHVDGATLTDGKVDGDNISFAQVVNFNGNEMKINYTGKADGDTIHFSRQVGDRPAMQFDAKRATDAAPPAAPPQ